MTKTHFGDPCIHCGIPHDDVPVGACRGDFTKAIPIAFRGLGVRYDNVEHFLVLLSNGTLLERWHHIAEQAPYHHFGWSRELVHPPRYDESLRGPS